MGWMIMVEGARNFGGAAARLTSYATIISRYRPAGALDSMRISGREVPLAFWIDYFRGADTLVRAPSADGLAKLSRARTVLIKTAGDLSVHAQLACQAARVKAWVNTFRHVPPPPLHPSDLHTLKTVTASADLALSPFLEGLVAEEHNTPFLGHAILSVGEDNHLVVSPLSSAVEDFDNLLDTDLTETILRAGLATAIRMVDANSAWAEANLRVANTQFNALVEAGVTKPDGTAKRDHPRFNELVMAVLRQGGAAVDLQLLALERSHFVYLEGI